MSTKRPFMQYQIFERTDPLTERVTYEVFPVILGVDPITRQICQYTPLKTDAVYVAWGYPGSDYETALEIAHSLQVERDEEAALQRESEPED